MPLKRGTLYENFQYVNQGKDKKDRINRFKQISCVQIKSLLDYTYNPNIKWLLKPGIPSYSPSRDEPSRLYLVLLRELKRLNNFMNFGPYANKIFKRDMLFKSLLESVHPEDAILLVNIKEKKLPFENITKELAMEAFKGSNFIKNWK